MALRPSLGLLGLALLAAPLLRAQTPAASREVDELVAWLTGTFDSKEQADPGDDPALRMVTVAVPKSLLSFGAPVLYREEAALDKPDRPFRQRFLRIEQDATGTILVRVFDLKDPIAAAGKWREASDLGLFGKNDVRERDGCLVTLRRVGDGYEGGTTGTRCVSSIRGAAYATSEAKIWKDRIEEWDRGFDGDGKQVWGPVKAPTRWVKRSTGVPGDPAPGAGPAPALPVVAAPPAAWRRRSAPPPQNDRRGRPSRRDATRRCLADRDRPAGRHLFGGVADESGREDGSRRRGGTRRIGESRSQRSSTFAESRPMALPPAAFSPRPSWSRRAPTISSRLSRPRRSSFRRIRISSSSSRTESRSGPTAP